MSVGRSAVLWGCHLPPGAFAYMRWGIGVKPGVRGNGGTEEEPSKGHQHVANKRNATRICRRFFGCSLANATLQNYYDLYGLWECALKHTSTLSFGQRVQKETEIGDRQPTLGVSHKGLGQDT